VTFTAFGVRVFDVEFMWNLKLRVFLRHHIKLLLRLQILVRCLLLYEWVHNTLDRFVVIKGLLRWINFDFLSWGFSSLVKHINVRVRLRLFSCNIRRFNCLIINRFGSRIYLLEVSILCLDVIIVETHASRCAWFLETPVLPRILNLFWIRFVIGKVLLRLRSLYFVRWLR